MLLGLMLASGCAQLQGIFKPTPPPKVRTRQTPPSAPVHPARQEPPPPQEPPLRLAPQISSDREKQLTEEINTTIQKVERILLSINQRTLQADQAETYQTVQSFLSQAREALGNKDFQQAMNLAQKAHVLSDELSTSVH